MYKLCEMLLVGALITVFLISGYMMFDSVDDSYRLIGWCDGEMTYANEEDEFVGTCTRIERNN